MKRRLNLLSLFFSLALPYAIWSQEINPYVTSTVGGRIKSETMFVDFTMGEIIGLTMGEYKNMITPGIQQPKYNIITKINEVAGEKFELHVYPNPFISEFIIEAKSEKQTMELNLYDSEGKSVYKRNFSDFHREIIFLDFLPNGVYLLELNNLKGASSTYTIIKTI